MSTITFAFDQKEINELIKNGDPAHDMLVSILSAKDKPDSKNNLFLAAQLSDPVSNAPVTTLKLPAVGCPVPPGWTKVNPGITHQQLNNSPKFIIPATEKNRLLDNNNGDLLASLDGPEESNDFQIKLSFKIANPGNNINETIAGGVL